MKKWTVNEDDSSMSVIGGEGEGGRGGFQGVASCLHYIPKANSSKFMRPSFLVSHSVTK
jgi:hypothetical protein